MAEIKSVAGAVFSKDRLSILLILRQDVPVWVLPGGAIDPGETPEEAVCREILEETGITVKMERLVGRYDPINRLAKPTHLYECTPLHGTPTPSAESPAVSYFSLAELPQMPPPYTEWITDALLPGPPLHKKLTSVNYPTLLKHLVLHPTLVSRFLWSRLKSARH